MLQVCMYFCCCCGFSCRSDATNVVDCSKFATTEQQANPPNCQQVSAQHMLPIKTNNHNNIIVGDTPTCVYDTPPHCC